MTARAYYGSLEGRWSGRFTLVVTSWAPGAAAVKLMATAARAVGGLGMATTLEADGADYVHTTRVTKAGALVFATTERIVIGEDGRSLVMKGEQRPALGRAIPYDATVEVAEDAKGAVYRIPWTGVEMVQRTAIVPEGLDLTQETPWSRGHVLLRRA